MNSTRRHFLKIAGISALGLGARPLIDKAIADTGQPKVTPDPKALVGKRWAMVVDQKKCLLAKENCKDCVEACHRVHNVPTMPNPKQEVKWIWLDKFEHVFPDVGSYMDDYVKETLKGLPLPTLCNHCDNPPCVRVCPTKATFRRPDGIVMMDFHRCIGCRYCMAACPYGARSLNWLDPLPYIKTDLNTEFPTRTRGVVEKCTFCDERLAKGLIPACVEACKEKALVFGDMNDPNSEVRKLLSKNPAVRRKSHLGTQPQVYYIL